MIITMVVREKDEILLTPKTSVAPLGIIAMEGATELGDKINKYLVQWATECGEPSESFLVEATCPRFS